MVCERLECTEHNLRIRKTPARESSAVKGTAPEQFVAVFGANCASAAAADDGNPQSQWRGLCLH